MWNNPFNTTFFALSLLAGLVGAYAQTSLSLEQALSIAEKNNLSLKIDGKVEELSQKDYQKSQALFLPQISLSHTAMGTTNPLMAFGSKLNQEILTQQDFNPSLLNDPAYIRNYATKVSVQQPLINVDGIYNRKAAKLNTEYIQHQNVYKKDFVLLEVKKAYMQLQVAIKQVEVLEKAQLTADVNLKYASDNLKHGYLQKSDFLDVEIRVQDVQNQLQVAKSNVLNASNYFSHLLNLKEGEIIIPTDELLPQLNLQKSNFALPANRSDLLAMNIAAEAQTNMLKASKMNFLPRLNAFGNLELFDDKIFGTEAKGYTIGAQLSWDIFKGGTQWAEVQKNKIEVEKTTLSIEQYKNQSQLEINKTQRGLLDAKNSLDLSAKSVEQSKEALKIRTNRFKEGLEKTTDLLMAETKYAEKQLLYLNAVFNYNFTSEYLKLLTKDK